VSLHYIEAREYLSINHGDAFVLPECMCSEANCLSADWYQDTFLPSRDLETDDLSVFLPPPAEELQQLVAAAHAKAAKLQRDAADYY